MKRTKVASKTSRYEVGYCKPPAQHRFVKGRSGNPKGGSGKRRNDAHEERIKSLIIDEAYREVALPLVRQFAEEKSATPGQVALAWLLHQGNDIVPIPGTKRRKYLEENLAAAALELSPADLEKVAGFVGSHKVSGPRYNPADLAAIDR